MSEREGSAPKIEVEITEQDWRNGFEPELIKQRPRGQENELQENIDWWHFSAYVLSLRSLDRERTERLITEHDKDEVIADFQKHQKQGVDETWWTTALYAARLKELGWHEQSFTDDEWRQFIHKGERLKDNNEWWQFAYYAARLSILDQEKARSLLHEQDWDRLESALKETRESQNEDASLLTIAMANNISMIDAQKGRSFFHQEDIVNASIQAHTIKTNEDWWRLAQYASAIQSARSNA